MAVKTIFMKYKLECGHNAQATVFWYTVREPTEPAVYHKGDSVKCQLCQYKMRKITSETKSVKEE